MEKPLVTVITITRNRADLIGRCIKSIQSQTYTNFEHIIVDGASTDNTEEVVQSFNDPRIRYIKTDEAHSSHKNCYDISFSEAKGDYICFLDDDDEYLPTKIEKQIKLIEGLSEDYGMVYCWMTFLDSKSGKTVMVHNPQLRGDVADEVVEVPTVSGTPTFLIKKDAFFSIGGWIDAEKTGLISDWAFGAEFCQHYKVDFIPESLVNVYVNHSAVRMSENENYYKDYFERNIKLSKYFLTTYKDIFDRYPQKSISHVKSIMDSYFRLGLIKEGWPYYRKLLKLDFSLKNLIKPFFEYAKYLCHGRH